jgi:glycosyltransferase involved in cell wall biosynthesis
VLAVTNSYPTEIEPSSGAFVAAQVDSLQALGLKVEVVHIRRDLEGRSAYRRISSRVGGAAGADLIHVMYGGVMAERVTRVTSAPTVVSFCGSDLNGVPVGGVIERMSAWYGVRASHRAAKSAEAVIVKSRGLAGMLPPEVDRSKVWVLPNGVDLKLFRPLERLECRSRLGWDADAHHLVFYVGGHGKRPELARAAVSAASAAGLRVHLHELAGIRQTEVPVWMNAADALICTSVREGSPNTVKEALACDLPVISVDVGDVRERIEGVDGCHIVPPKAAAIAGAIAEVCSGGARVNGTAAVRELSLERVAERVLEVYSYAMKRYHSRRAGVPLSAGTPRTRMEESFSGVRDGSSAFRVRD